MNTYESNGPWMNVGVLLIAETNFRHEVHQDKGYHALLVFSGILIGYIITGSSIFVATRLIGYKNTYNYVYAISNAF